MDEADKYKAEDEANKARIEARNALENAAYQFKSTVQDEKLADKLEASDKEAITAACDEAISWLDANPNAETEALQARLKDLVERFPSDPLPVLAWCRMRGAAA